MASDDEDASLAHFLESEVLSELSDPVFMFLRFFWIFFIEKSCNLFWIFVIFFFFFSLPDKL